MKTCYTNYVNGQTGFAEEMLVEDGRVVERAEKVNFNDSNKTDLSGKQLLPAFIDAHCHILPTGLDLQKLHLGSAGSHEEVLALVRTYHQQSPSGWLLAVHYDQTKFEDGQHLSRWQLDAISSVRPIILRHSNGHASVANTAALVAAGVSESALDPSGGTYGRTSDGKLDGTLFELAHEIVTSAAPTPSLEQMVDAICRASEKMHAMGIVLASDMMTGRFNLRQELLAYKLAAEKGAKVATRLYLQWKEVFGPKGVGPEEVQRLGSEIESWGTRIAGVKIFADGALGSATAAIYGSYSGQPATGPVLSPNMKSAGVFSEKAVSGQLIYSPEKLTQMVQFADHNGFQVAVHSIGDYATDLVMDAFESTGNARRHRLEHAMILSDLQIERLSRLRCQVTFQPEFLCQFGHAYLRQLGPERASKLKRIRSCLAAGIPISLNTDRPIVPGEPWLGIEMATKRPEMFDQDENISFNDAINGWTHGAACATHDEGEIGKLNPGQRAEFILR